MTASLSEPSTLEIMFTEQRLTIPSITTEHLGKLENLRFSYRVAGNPLGTKVLVLGGLSADRQVTNYDGQAGWWHELFAEGRKLSPTHCCIISVDFLSGKGDSEQIPFDPAEDETPLVTTQDQATFIIAGLKLAGFEQLDAVIGASLGGSIALAMGKLAADYCKQLYVLCAGFSSPPHSVGLRQLQRAIVRLGAQGNKTTEGVTLARALGMVTYRSFDEFNKRFADDPTHAQNGIWNYLHSRGEAFAEVFRPTSFLMLSQSIDYHDVDHLQVDAPTKFWCVESDLLVPIEEVESKVAEMPNGQVKRVRSIYGHDAFLKEIDSIDNWLDF